MSTQADLWTRLMTAGTSEGSVVKEKIHAVLEASRMPEKFHDRDMQQLLEMGAIPILKRMVGVTYRKIPENHEFNQAFSRCPKIE